MGAYADIFTGYPGLGVVRFDISPVLINEARINSPGGVFSHLACDLARLPFKSGSYDVVVASDVIEHTLDPLQCLQQIHAALNESGILLLSVPNERWELLCKPLGMT
ncbi:MAG: class I SAM-dependent methyltransferase, partial [Eubacteriales bacterium]|nr:class I SAM-dependent methyltransferase [Eubacteriales bacterium]